MKNFLFAAFLFIALGSASAQTSDPNGASNNHGEDRCMCIGIGIPNTHTNPGYAQNPSDTTKQLDKGVVVDKTISYNPIQLFWWRGMFAIHP